MSVITSGFHPGFDALSAHADAPDVDRARTRVGRHVATCARCREIVNEIQAMGEAARALELPGAPDGLWSRIEERVAHDAASAATFGGERVMDVPVGREVESDGATVHEPNGRGGDWQRRAALGVLLAAVLGTGVIVVSSGRSLGAATPSRFSLSSEHVAPGGSVAVRYRPIAAFGDEPTLTVWARYESAEVAHAGDQLFGVDHPLERVGTLQRMSPQEYAGSVTLPIGVVVGFFAVGDSSGRVMDRSSGPPQFLAALLAADESGRPSFEALLALLTRYRQRVEGGQIARAMDSMERQYPSRPETWLLAYSIKRHGLIHDVVAQFVSRVRTYEDWHDRLAGVPRLSAYVEQTMATIGDDLMDSVRFDFWVKRLMADHPDDVRRQRIWLAQHGQAADSDATASAADRRRWQLQFATTTPRWVLARGTLPWLRDTALAPELAKLLHRDLAALRDSVPLPTVFGSPARMADRLAVRRAAIRTRLGAVQLLRGETLAARESLDVVVREVGPACPMAETIRWRAEAELQLGQTDAAQKDLAYLATTESRQVMMVEDSVPQLLGAHYSPESWSSAKAAATAWHRSCFAAWRERRRSDGPATH